MPDQISNELRDFIASMIEVNVEKRITVDEAMDHPWIRMGMETSEECKMAKGKINSDIIESLTRYKSQSLLKKAAMNVLVKHLNGKQIKELRSEFQKLDTNHSGYLEPENIKEALTKIG